MKVNYKSCEACTVVLDMDLSYILTQGEPIWDGDTYKEVVLCPLCKNDIITDTVADMNEYPL